MKPLLSTLALLAVGVLTFAQSSINTEEFELSFSPTKGGGRFLYNGKAHSFTIDVVADSIQVTETPNFILANNHIVQTSTVALPESNVDLTKLTVEQQKGALEGYVNYELEYFKNDLKIKVENLKKEWVTIDSRIWLIWTFDFPKQKASEEAATPAKSQVYASTICFNQVLDLNMPVMPGITLPQCKELINKLMASLKLADKRM